jgi:serine protease Do
MDMERSAGWSVITIAWLAALLAASSAFGQATRPSIRPANWPWGVIGSATRPAAPSTQPAFPGIRNIALPALAAPARGIKDLAALEKRIQDLVVKVLPATVAVRTRGGQGSGVIISRDGYILTAGHVIGDANQRVTVIFPNGRQVEARSLGVNHAMDSGLVKITTPGEWPAVGVGSSSDLKLGDWCIGLGHPNGYQRQRPPVLRLGRILLNGSNMVMTDCTLVGGDSGGPLFDLNGNLIGIHSRIGRDTTMNMHVPVDTYKETWPRLAAAEVWGRGPRSGGPVLGVHGVSDPKGCRIERVVPGSSGEKAGMRVGDVVTKFAGARITDLESLIAQISRRRAGDQVEIEVLRNGENVKLNAVLGRQR